MKTREQIIDTLLESNLIGGYDWLGTSSRYPSDEQIRNEVGEIADIVLGTRKEALQEAVEALRGTVQTFTVFDDYSSGQQAGIDYAADIVESMI